MEVNRPWLIESRGLTTFYPGASSEDVELNVTGIERLTSYSMENISSIRVVLDSDVKDQERVKREVRDAVGRVTDFPDAVVEITIDNGKVRLRPGIFAEVTIPVEVHGDVVLIPLSAIIEDDTADKGTVLVVANGRIKRKEVGLGLSGENMVEITSGLAEGELVVTAGQHSIKDGQEVIVMKP